MVFNNFFGMSDRIFWTISAICANRALWDETGHWALGRGRKVRLNLVKVCLEGKSKTASNWSYH